VEPPVDPEVNYLLIPRRAAVRLEAQRLFGDEGPLAGWYVGSDAATPDEAGERVDDEAAPTP
jgi:hypothetical protein